MMARFIGKGVGLTAVIFIQLFLLSQLNVALDRSLSRQSRNFNGIIQNAESYGALLVGNSHATSLDVCALGYSCARLVLGGSDLYEMNYSAAKILPHLENVEVAFIPISNYIFHVNNKVGYSADRMQNRVKLYAYQPGFNYIEGDFWLMVRGKLLSAVRADHWADIMINVLAKNIRTDENDASVPVVKSMSRDQLDYNAQRRVQYTLNQANEMAGNQPTIEADTFAELTALVELLQAEGVRVVLFTPPYADSYTSLFDEAMIAEKDDLMDTLTVSHGITYFDYSESADIVHDETLFRDSDHLNIAGIAEFSAQLKAVLEDAE